VVQHNLLHPDAPVESDHRFVPHAIFSSPQVASVGLTERQAREQGLDPTVAQQAYGDVAYGWAMEDTDHFVKLVGDRASGRLLGAHLIGPEASSLIQPLIQAMSFGQTAAEVARGQYWIHPAMAEVVENALLALGRAGRSLDADGKTVGTTPSCPDAL
jgi:mycothione reductase